MDQVIGNLDYDQRFPEIQIDSGTEAIRLKHVSFQQALNQLQEKLNQMHESKFYKNIIVHFGAKSLKKINYLQEYYLKREQILKLELQNQKEYIKNIVNAQSQQDLAIFSQQHQLAQNIIKRKRQDDTEADTFIPCLFIEAAKKNWFYGSITQSFDRNGMGNISAKLGWRSPFKKYDSLEFNFQQPVSKSLRIKYYNAGIDWINPIKKFGQSIVHVKSANELLFKGIDNQLSSIGYTLQHGKNRYEWDYSYRKPYIRQDIAENILNNFYKQSRKFAFKYTHIFKNNIKVEDITEGQYSDFKAEAALPIIADSTYLRLQYRYRKFYDTFNLRKYVDNELARKFLWKSTIETNFSATAIKQFGSSKYVNDILESMDMRGYENIRKPLPSYANMKASLKFNIHNYPVLKDANVIMFLYAQTGISFLKESSLINPYFAATSGLGLSFALRQVAQLQILCNAAQYQNKNQRQPINFQVRFGLFD